MTRQYVSSSNLEWVEYNSDSKILKVGFLHGGIYEYYEVPEYIYEELLNASSHGSYFYYNIRDSFNYSRVQ